LARRLIDSDVETRAGAAALLKARKSTLRRRLNAPDGYQLDALQASGCVQIFEDRVSGAGFERAGLDQALAALEPGSVLVVWKLDRLGRSMLETVKIVLDLDRRGIGFRSLTESFDTKTALGRGVLALLAAVAEDERDRLRERTRAGMQAARRAGKHIASPDGVRTRYGCSGTCTRACPSFPFVRGQRLRIAFCRTACGETPSLSAACL
jgi:DNA invertase Pin-like site-specific DNA recombinase